MNEERVLLVFGTRPEAIKLAPVVEALRHHPRLTPVVAVTGQHQGPLHQVLEVFDLVPDFDLKIHTTGQSLAQVASRALTGLGAVVEEVDPAVVVVQGDTTTTFAAALAAFYNSRRVVHVEAGLRTRDLMNPFPEEANRRLTTQVCALHLAATGANRRNLVAEGIEGNDIAVIGNTVIDALTVVKRMARPWGDRSLAHALGEHRRRGDRPTVLVTAHRRESWGGPLQSIARSVADVARSHPGAQFIWPLHPNPAVHRCVIPTVGSLPNVTIGGPARYDDFVRLMTIADVAVTDSGGVQEEAPALGLPVLVIRDVTERQEAIECGAARLVGTDRHRITRQLRQLLDDPDERRSMTVHESPYGDGRASARAAHAIAELLGVGRRLADFVPCSLRSGRDGPTGLSSWVGEPSRSSCETR